MGRDSSVTSGGGNSNYRGRIGIATLDPNRGTKRRNFGCLDESAGSPDLAAKGCQTADIQGSRARFGQGQPDNLRQNLALVKRIEERVHNTRGESHSQNDWWGNSVTVGRTAVEECSRRDKISMAAGTRDVVAARWERGAA